MAQKIFSYPKTRPKKYFHSKISKNIFIFLMNDVIGACVYVRERTNMGELRVKNPFNPMMINFFFIVYFIKLKNKFLI